MAADDVSADAEMMLFAIAHNDAMFALMCPQAHIIAAGSIMCEACIICPTGQTSLKKPRFREVFSGAGGGGRPPEGGAVVGSDVPPARHSLPTLRPPSYAAKNRLSPYRLRRFFWCRWRGSNPHGVLAHRILSPARLPIPSHRRCVDQYITIKCILQHFLYQKSSHVTKNVSRCNRYQG